MVFKNLALKDIKVNTNLKMTGRDREDTINQTVFVVYSSQSKMLLTTRQTGVCVDIGNEVDKLKEDKNRRPFGIEQAFDSLSKEAE